MANLKLYKIDYVKTFAADELYCAAVSVSDAEKKVKEQLKLDVTKIELVSDSERLIV